MEIGLLAAVATGLLTLLSPCSALLLPSFFAYAFTTRSALLARTAAFTVGLMLVLVPLGLGVRSVVSLFYLQRDLLITVAGWTIIGFGVLQLVTSGFGLSFTSRLHSRAGAMSSTGGGGPAATVRSYAGTVLLGAVFGLAGFCSGPALGVILTLAATSPTPWYAAALLAAYAVGMALPLFALALLWRRFDLASRSWVRGRELRWGPLRIHSTALVSGLLFILVGVVFLAFDGTAGLLGVVGADLTDTELAAQSWVVDHLGAVPVWWLLVAVAAVALAVALWRARRVDTDRQDEPVPDRT